jgi:hypothetical protein
MALVLAAMVCTTVAFTESGPAEPIGVFDDRFRFFDDEKMRSSAERGASPDMPNSESRSIPQMAQSATGAELLQQTLLASAARWTPDITATNNFDFAYNEMVYNQELAGLGPSI